MYCDKSICILSVSISFVYQKQPSHQQYLHRFGANRPHPDIAPQRKCHSSLSGSDGLAYCSATIRRSARTIASQFPRRAFNKMLERHNTSSRPYGRKKAAPKGDAGCGAGRQARRGNKKRPGADDSAPGR